MKTLMSFAFACFFSSSLLATSISNQELLKACKNPSIGPQNFCYGFVISAANAAQFYRNIADVDDKYINICFPKDISNKKIVDLYIAWAEKNPTVGESPAFVGVSTSFSTKYSCSKKKNTK
ncbi:MAG: hypothetical protein KBD90_05960 [Alphaproteobacteria bacterium]|nr:hypothetical protein [Alphaproteobacteria bacterium]